MKPIPFLRIALVTGFFLLIPLIAMQFTQEVQWTFFDFVFATVLIGGTQLAYAFVSRKMKNSSYKLAAGLALMGMFALVWVNGAVGIIGDEDTGINILYFAVTATIFLGAIVSGLAPSGMSRALYSAAVVQMIIPVLAFMFVRPAVYEAPGILGVFVLNAAFAMVFAGSGMLFNRAAKNLAL